MKKKKSVLVGGCIIAFVGLSFLLYGNSQEAATTERPPGVNDGQRQTEPQEEAYSNTESTSGSVAPTPLSTSRTPSKTILANISGAPISIHPDRYRKVLFESVIADKDITYKTTYHTRLDTDVDSNFVIEDDFTSPKDLKLNIYQPANDNLASRPVLLFVYGGGFIEGDRYQQEQAAIYYAKLGYVTVTLDYTMMPPDNTMNPVPDPTLSVYPRLIYRSVKDIYDAYSWIIEHKDVYRADVTRIGVGGWSAGGLISQIFVHGNNTPEPSGVRAVVGLSNVLQPVIATASPLNGYRVFSQSFTPRSLFASYDIDEGFAGYYNDHEEDCAYLRNVVMHQCASITYPGSGHPMGFNLAPNIQDSTNFFAQWVGGN